MKIVIEINPPEERDNTALVALLSGMIPFIPKLVEDVRNFFSPRECPECDARQRDEWLRAHKADQARARQDETVAP